ncbi:MAG TPA: hypothetical protein V6D17_10175, partial [Candidatus Obscuribacterales bacterium]
MIALALVVFLKLVQKMLERAVPVGQALEAGPLATAQAAVIATAESVAIEIAGVTAVIANAVSAAIEIQQIEIAEATAVIAN